MSEQSTEQQSSPLRTERGRTTVQKPVVYQVVGRALQEIEGIQMGGGGRGSSEAGTQGVSIEVGQEEAAIDLTMMLEHGRSLTEVTEAVRHTVASRVENLTGLRVVESNITIANIYFPEQSQDRGQHQAQDQDQQQESV